MMRQRVNLVSLFPLVLASNVRRPNFHSVTLAGLAGTIGKHIRKVQRLLKHQKRPINLIKVLLTHGTIYDIIEYDR